MQEELIIKIFSDIHDFCKIYKEHWVEEIIKISPEYKDNLLPKTSMDISEIMTITILFHLLNFRQFKRFYQDFVCKYLKIYFPNLLSYNRFVEVSQLTLAPLALYTSKYKMGKCTGISFVDSTPFVVCHNRRIHSHKVFKGIAERGKSSTGWFYGFKLHLIINDMGEILSFCLTPGNVDDRNIELMEKITKELFGKMFGDKGYISKSLFDYLFSKSITLITKVKKNMKNKLMLMEDKILLRKRAVIESVNDFLKNICQVEHSRHRSLGNFLVNMVSALAAYSFIEKKPSLKIKYPENTLLLY